ncbi:carbohydrate ABC transporter permease [Oricola sp.]|uniref:carbohydrate ABC transporter permease n=1 Tax=Oricola sp. TaxID=1979950 RepID=UPI003BAA42BD
MPKLPKSFIPTLLIAIVTAVFMTPLLWLVVSAFRPEQDILGHLSPLTWNVIIPDRVTTENFTLLIEGGFGRAVFNSVFVAFGTVAIGLIVNSMAAFALSAIDYPGRGVVFAVVVVTFLIPFEAIAIPLAGTVRALNLDNSYSALMGPGIANGFAIFMLRQFFLGIPKELQEAARVDGANLFQIYWRIYLPLSKAPMVGAGVIIFLFQWQAYLWPLLVTSTREYELAPVALAKLIGQFDFDLGQMLAGAVLLALIPTLVVLPLQRHFTQSIAGTGLK